MYIFVLYHINDTQMNEKDTNKSTRKNPEFKNFLSGVFTYGDFKKIQKMTGLHYQTVRKTLVYGRRNEAVIEAAEKVRKINKQLNVA